jgi:hypothetical protein
LWIACAGGRELLASILIVWQARTLTRTKCSVVAKHVAWPREDTRVDSVIAIKYFMTIAVLLSSFDLGAVD